VDAANLFHRAGLGISLPPILIMELRRRLWDVRSGPARRGLSIPDPGVAVAALTLLRQRFEPVLREANGFRGSRYSWYALSCFGRFCATTQALSLRETARS
jgi:hypothetical protein